MAYQKQNYFQRRTRDRGPRSNNRISALEVQVISNDGKNLGVLQTKEAIQIAKDEGLDLIEISPNAKPPVCKIIDIGKYKYDLQKKANKAKKKQKIINLKEIKLRPVTDIHDYNFKIKNAQKFLNLDELTPGKKVIKRCVTGDNSTNKNDRTMVGASEKTLR